MKKVDIIKSVDILSWWDDKVSNTSNTNPLGFQSRICNIMIWVPEAWENELQNLCNLITAENFLGGYWNRIHDIATLECVSKIQSEIFNNEGWVFHLTEKRFANIKKHIEKDIKSHPPQDEGIPFKWRGN